MSVRNFAIVSTPENKNMPAAISATPRRLSVCFGGGADSKGVEGVTAMFVSPGFAPGDRAGTTLRWIYLVYQEFYPKPS